MISNILIIFTLLIQIDSKPMMLQNVISSEYTPDGKMIGLDSFSPQIVSYPDYFCLTSRVFIDFDPSLENLSFTHINLVDIPAVPTSFGVRLQKPNVNQPGTVFINGVDIGTVNEFGETLNGQSRIGFFLGIDYYRSYYDSFGRIKYTLEIFAYVFDDANKVYLKHPVFKHEFYNFYLFSLKLKPQITGNAVTVTFYQLMFHFKKRVDDIFTADF